MTFRGKDTREVVVEVEEPNTTRIEVVEEDLLQEEEQEEGEDPQIVILGGTKNTKNGTKTNHLGPDPIETSKNGKKTHGVIPGVIETTGSITDTLMIPMKEKATILVIMRTGREQEALAKEDIEEGIIAPGMSMEEEEEDQEGTTAQMRETAGDTLAKTDEKSAQGP